MPHWWRSTVPVQWPRPCGLTRLPGEEWQLHLPDGATADVWELEPCPHSGAARAGMRAPGAPGPDWWRAPAHHSAVAGVSLRNPGVSVRPGRGRLSPGPRRRQEPSFRRGTAAAVSAAVAPRAVVVVLFPFGAASTSAQQRRHGGRPISRSGRAMVVSAGTMVLATGIRRRSPSRTDPAGHSAPAGSRPARRRWPDGRSRRDRGGAAAGATPSSSLHGAMKTGVDVPAQPGGPGPRSPASPRP